MTRMQEQVNRMAETPALTNIKQEGMKKKIIMNWLMLALLAVQASAQCKFSNTAFKGGEFLSYNLYYNWKFVWVRAGTASMYTVQSRYNGMNAYRSSLTTRGSSKVDKMFMLHDTLLSYCSTDMVPLYFRKGAHEGSRYTVDEVWYNYKGGNVQLTQRKLNHKGEEAIINATSQECVYDMLNIFLRARSFDPSNWKKGYAVKIPIADGNSIQKAQLKYRGKTVVKADNGKKYRCLELSYVEWDDGKYKEIVRFYVTDDSNHIPVRLDMFLKFGSAKAFLTNVKGNLSPFASVVK